MYEELAIAIRDRINQRCCAETGEPISGASGRLTCNIALTGRATLYAREVLSIDDHPSDLVRPCSRVRESLGQLDAPDVDDKALLSDLFGEPS